MDESKDKQLESIVSVNTISKTVGVSEEDCEGEDVMFEVLGSEVVFDGIERISEELGIDELGRRDGEFDEMSPTRELQCIAGNANSVDVKLHSLSTITSPVDGKTVVNVQQTSLTLTEQDTKPRKQDSPYEDVVAQATLPESATLNQGQEKPVILESLRVGSENAVSKRSDLHAQTCIIEPMDGVNDSIPVPEPDKQIDSKSIDAAVTSSVGHGNGELDEIKLNMTDMEIDAPSGSHIHSESKIVEMKDIGEDIENSVILMPLSKVSEEEALVVGMDIDAADTNFINEWMTCEPPHDYLKSNTENEVYGADILAKCNTETSLASNSIKSSDPIASGTMDQQNVEIESGTLTVVENLGTGSPVLDAEIPCISVPDNPATDLHDGSREDAESPSEGVADQPPVPDDSGVEVVNQEPKCESDASHIMYMDNQPTDGVGEIGLNIGAVQEVPEAVCGEQVSVNNALLNEGDGATLLRPLTVDADGGYRGSTAKVVPKDPDEQVNLLNASTNEDKTVELSDTEIVSMNVVTEIDSIMEDGQGVQEVLTDQMASVDKSAVKDETAKLSDYVTSAADVSTQNYSNVEEREEVQEQAANAEKAVYLDNAGPDDKEYPKELNPVPSGVVDTQGETYMADENIIAGPFIVETESPGESTVGSGYVDVDSAPTHDENGGADGHVVQSPVKELEQETADDVSEGDTDMKQEIADGEQEEAAAAAEQVEGEEVKEEHVSGSAKPQKEVEKNFSAYAKAESLLKDHRVSYELPLEIKGGFSVSDLVWGKVKSHPWWPGQIFHPSDSSEKAMKYFRKDCYLVAYFGDRSFAWNEDSVLKPFINHFSVAEKQHNTESFQNAVSCALEEVSRRTELGLACSCVSQEAYDKIRYQRVENAGIREELSVRDGVDRCSGSDYFQPDKLIEYVRSLAVFPTSSVDRLELVIAKSQLSAFVRLKGIDSLADFQYYEGIFGQVDHEDSAATVDSKSTLKGPKRKHNLKDIVYKRRREKSMTELMGETMYYLDGEFDSHEEDDNMLSPTGRTGMKRKASGFDNLTKTISVAKVSGSSNPQQSFKVGECIRRAANQLTGSSSILKSSGDGGNSEHLEDDADVLQESNDEMSPSPSKQPTLDEMLSQLHLCAQDPMKGYSFFGDIISFFTEFRNLAVLTQRQRMRKAPSRKRKASVPVGGTPETFEFDDRNDSYWKDMVVQNNTEAKPARRSRKRKDEQVVPVESEKPSQSKPRKSSRKQYFHGPLGSTDETPLGDEVLKNMPAELMLNFSGMGSIPSEINLNKMFRSFGPLKESETEIDAPSSRARVVFKKRSDAEVAYSSAAMFNIFGSMVVNYQLNYTPSVSFKSPPLALTEGQEKAT